MLSEGPATGGSGSGNRDTANRTIVKSWPSLDPLSLATLVGIGLLLVAVCERLRIVRELRTLTTLMRSAIADAQREPPA